jgi:L-amino acid N-acyltransferase YncA
VRWKSWSHPAMPRRLGGSRRLVPLEERHVAGMCRIFNEHVADGFAAYPETAVSEEAMRSLLSQTLESLAVAAETADGSLLGFGFLRPYQPVETFAHTTLITIFLDAQYTRGGIGSEILRYLELRARRQGITKVLAHVSSRNAPSLAFHQKNGYMECGRLPEIGRKFGEPFDVVWMIKTL